MVYGTGPATVCWGGRPVGERAFCVGCHGTKDNRDVDRSKCGPLAIIDRLAAYEDTGLGPDEITTEPYGCVFYCNRKCNLDGDWCAEGPGCPYEIGAETAKRLLELARAEKDGRLKVIPCKVGETLWSLYNYPASGICRIVVAEVSIFKNITVISADNYGMIPEKEIGKTVFLTREEAEAALKKRGEADNAKD